MSNKVNNVPQHKTIPATPGTPDTGFGKIYIKTDRLWYGLDDLGVETLLSGGGGGGGISLIDLSAVSPLTYDNSTGSFSINQSSGSTSGYLSSSDWLTFNNKISGSGTLNRILKWTPSGSQVGNSQLLDDGTRVSVTQLPITFGNAKFGVRTTSGVTAGIEGHVELLTNALAGDVFGVAGSINQSNVLYGHPVAGKFEVGPFDSDFSAVAYGVYAKSSTNSTSFSIGGFFKAENTSAVPGAAAHAIQLQDGTQSTGKFLKSVTDNGHASWANITASDISGVQGTLTLTTTGSSGTATLVGNILNIPQYSGGSGGITLTSLSANAPITYNNTNGVFSINQSNGSTNGYLSSTDWTSFNNKIGGGGLADYVAKWTPDNSTIGTSIIRDNGTTIGVNTAPNSSATVDIVSNTSTGLSVSSSIIPSNGATIKTGISLSVSGSVSDNRGIDLAVSGGTTSNTGINASATGTAGTTTWGAIFTAQGGGTKYSIRLTDGTNAANKFLKSVTASGDANWATLTAADVSGVQGTLTLTTTGSSGAATLVGNTLNIPQYSGGSFTWPAHIEYSATEKTLWSNGAGNIYDNVSYGESALKSSTGGGNTAIGYTALYTDVSGTYNTAVGTSSLYAANGATYNTSIGYGSQRATTSGGNNTSLGARSLWVNTTGANNTAIGMDAGYLLNGSDNVVLGYDAMSATTTGNKAVAIGALSMGGSPGEKTIAIGYSALSSVNDTGTSNIAIGAYSLERNGNGSYNIAIGENAFERNYSGNNNTIVGYNSTTYASTYSDNVVIGAESGQSVSGNKNTVIGTGATAGNFNSGSVVLGYGAWSTASNQFAIGSPSDPVGILTDETVTSTKTWTVKINNGMFKILLAPA
jgi:hypothetical protein